VQRWMYPRFYHFLMS